MEAGAFWSLGDYAIVGDLWAEPGRVLATALDVEGRDVVDLATGTGVTAIAMAQRGASSMTGIDASPKMLVEARRRAATAGLEVHWSLADLGALPLRDRSADLVVSTFGLMFAADPRIAVGECRRIVRPGGQIVFTSWSGGGLFGRIRQVMGRYFPTAPEPWHEDPDAIRTMVAADIDVVEEVFDLHADSAEAFVDQLERYSAPFVAAKETLGDEWPQARRDLCEAVTSSGRSGHSGFTADVGYLVSTISSP